MSQPTLIFAVASLVLLLLYSIGLFIYRLYFHPLSRYPGPWYCAVSSLPNFYLNNVRGTWYKKVKNLHEKYGEFVRIGPNCLAVDGHVGWNDIFGIKPASRPEFQKSAKFFPPVDMGNSIIRAETQDHRRMRRRIDHGFTDTAFQRQLPTMKSYIDQLIAGLANAEGRPINLSKYYNCFTFNLIADLCYGEPVAGLTTGAPDPMMTTLFNEVKMISRLRIFAEYPSLTPLMRLLLPIEELKKRELYQVSSRLKAMSRLESGQKRQDLMRPIMDNNNVAEDKCLSMEELVANTKILMLGGSETTATNLCGLTYYLMQNPQVYKKLTCLIRESFPTEADINETSCLKLEYLSACIKEALRLYPPAAETPGRISSGAMVSGHYMPKGTELIIHQWATNRLAQNFANPDKFVPERWLAPDHPEFPTEYAEDNRDACQPFSFGPRNCPGQQFAWKKLRLVVARVLWRFDIVLEAQEQDWMEDQKVWIVYEKKPLICRVLQKEGCKEAIV